MRFAPLVAVVVLLAACGGGDDDEADSLAPTTTAELVASGAIDIDLTPDTLPDSFPVGVPVPADIVIEGTDVLPGETTTLFDVTGWHNGEPIRAARDYLAVLDEAGFEVTSRTEAPESLFFIADDGEWFVSAGFFPDPVRLEGTSVGLTVGPANAMPDDS